MENEIITAAEEVLIRSGRALSGVELAGGIHELAWLRVAPGDLEGFLDPEQFPRDTEGRLGLPEFPPCGHFRYLDPEFADRLERVRAKR